MTVTRIVSTVTAVDAGARKITGRLVTFGEVGRTSAGPLKVAPGTLTLPDPALEVLAANVEHEKPRPVGRITAALETEAGIDVEVTVARTTAGDDLLVEAAEGIRTGMSFEVADATIRAGELVAGRLTGMGFVVVPAFPSSRVESIAAAEHEGDEDEIETPEGDTPAGDPTPDDTDPGSVNPDPADVESTDEKEGTDVSDVKIVAGAPAGLPAAGSKGPATLEAFLESVTAANVLSANGASSSEITAALADIATPSVTSMPAQWIGELWQGVEYARRIVPLMTPGTLTSLKVNSWRWAVLPEVDTWAGDKTAVPSNAADTEAVTADAIRLAGAHDLPREHLDFNTGVVESYYRAMAASYARKSDAYAAAQLVAAATSGGTAGSTDLLTGIIVGALQVAELGSPAYALVNPAQFKALATVTTANAPAFLDIDLSFTGEATGKVRLVATSAVTAGTVVVGAREAASFHELPGVPIRARALDMVKGGTDEGVFGYAAFVLHEPSALVEVALTV